MKLKLLGVEVGSSMLGDLYLHWTVRRGPISATVYQTGSWSLGIAGSTVAQGNEADAQAAAAAVNAAARNYLREFFLVLKWASET